MRVTALNPPRKRGTILVRSVLAALITGVGLEIRLPAQPQATNRATAPSESATRPLKPSLKFKTIQDFEKNIGEPALKTPRKYVPKAMAASAIGAAKPTVAETNPAMNPSAG